MIKRIVFALVIVSGWQLSLIAGEKKDNKNSRSGVSVRNRLQRSASWDAGMQEYWKFSQQQEAALLRTHLALRGIYDPIAVTSARR
jgi:hypothetical protein